MKKIYITDISHAYTLNENNKFVCAHENTHLERPCCNGDDCACAGLYAVWCHNNECDGISEEDASIICERYLYES